MPSTGWVQPATEAVPVTSRPSPSVEAVGHHAASNRLDATFASDNSAGLDTTAAAAIAEANDGFSLAYGEDRWSDAAHRSIEEHFGSEVTAYFVSSGTAANVLAVGSLPQIGSQVICSAGAHLYNDEAGAIEALTRCSMRALPHHMGKMSAADWSVFSRAS